MLVLELEGTDHFLMVPELDGDLQKAAKTFLF